LVAAGACLIAAGRVSAQDVCLAPVESNYAPTSVAPLSDLLEINFGNVAVDPDGATQMFDGIQFSYRGGRVRAESANAAPGDNSLEVLGDVSLEGEGFVVFADDLRFDRASEVAAFAGAGLNLNEGERRARATAETIIATPDGNFLLSDLSFTTCPEDDVDWVILARTLETDREAGFATARGIVLKFKGVPILKAPYFSFPLDDRRKSGFLTPQLAKGDRTGYDLTVPYYLNLAPNYDLLLEPRYMGDRGLQLGSRFRYLLPASGGSFDIEYLTHDRQLSRARHFASLDHQSLFGENWQLIASIDDVSDAAYFEDLGDSLGVISQTHLNRSVDVSYHGQRWSIVTRVQEYQTIDNLISEIDRPYQRLPQTLFTGRWGDRLVGFESMAETVRFDRSIGVTGWRFDSTQEVSLRFARAGLYLTPAVGFRQTSYRIDATPSSAARSLSRGLPVASIDSGLRFERGAGRDRSWIQTIEPRMLYVSIPYEDQTDVPVFDTVLPDFNLVQLFSKYQFVGGDRIADTNRVSVGLTTRLIESVSGRERISATIGQTRFRDPRRVMLPSETAIDSTRSNYIARLDIGLSAKWNLDLGYQRNAETSETVRTETRFEFRPQDDRLFGFGYRQRKDLLEQGDLSLIWPIGGRWRVIGQYSFSLLEKKPLEQFAGLEYEACCWRFRVTNRRYIVRSTGATDSSISLEFELKGLAQRRASPEELLGRGILGAQRLNQNFN
jgi:LPS-assembly protein